MKLKKSIRIQIQLFKQLFNKAYQQNLKFFFLPYSKILILLIKQLWIEGIIAGWKIQTSTINLNNKVFLIIYLKYSNNQNSLLCLTGYKTLKIHNIITYKQFLVLKQSIPFCILFNGKSFITQSTLIKQKQQGILIFIFI